MKLDFDEIEIDIKEIEVLGEKVQVKQYLPMADKNSILEMTIQTADGGTVVNTLALEAIFELYLVFKYSDIKFTDEEKEDLFGTYDKLEKNGVIEEVVKAIPEIEYNLLHNSLIEMVEEYKKYRNSAKGFIDTLMLFAPAAAEKFNSIVENFDEEKLATVVDIANNAGFRK